MLRLLIRNVFQQVHFIFWPFSWVQNKMHTTKWQTMLFFFYYYLFRLVN